MADTKLADLVELLGSEIDVTLDWIYVDDVSEGAAGGKKIHPDEFVAAGLAMAPAGAVGTPALAFADDVDTGLYLSAVGELAAAVGGVKVGMWDATGLKVCNSDGSVSGMILRPGGIGLVNILIGTGAHSALTTGSYNVGIGASAGNVITSGGNNVAIGTSAGVKVTTGSGNIGIGNNAGAGLLTGSYTVAIGYECFATGTGAGTVAVGFQALKGATGTYNTAVGQSCCPALSSGASNVAMGYLAAQFVTTGSNNVAIGSGAGRYYGSGTDHLTTPENSIYIGYQARGASDADDNSIVIGYDIPGLGANTTTIGNASTVTAQIRGAHRLDNVAAPTNGADMAFIYAADQAAGNSCVHAMTEGGAVVKLFPGSAIADAVSEADAVTKLNTLLAHLRLMGIIAAA